MTRQLLTTINATAFFVCIISIFAAVVVALLGIWGVMGRFDLTLWRSLGSCGTFFAAAVCTSLAIRCFKSNDEIPHAAGAPVGQ